jgi:DNA-binding MarR family transcriptional regulator
LDEVETAAWRQVAALMTRLPAALDTELQRDAGISHFEYAVLSALSEAPDRTLRMSGLADLAHGSLSRLSHVVGRLEERGWVERVACPSDRRATNAVLTDAGFAAVVAAAPGHVDEVRRLVIDPLTRSQLQALAAIGERITASITAARGRAERDTRVEPARRSTAP